MTNFELGGFSIGYVIATSELTDSQISSSSPVRTISLSSYDKILSLVASQSVMSLRPLNRQITVGSLKFTRRQVTKKQKFQTPDAGLIMATTAAPRREGRNPRLSSTAAQRREGRNPRLSGTAAPRRVGREKHLEGGGGIGVKANLETKCGS